MKKSGGPQQDKRLIVAIVDFTNQTGVPYYDTFTDGLTGIMLDELQKTKAFRLIERNRVGAVLDELKMSMSGLVDPETAKQVGKQLGVDALLFGNITSVKYSTSKPTIFIMWTEGQNTEVTLDGRLVRVDTGEIMSTGRTSSYVRQRQWVAFWFAKIGRIMDKNSVIHKGLELACRQLSIDLASEAYK